MCYNVIDDFIAIYPVSDHHSCAWVRLQQSGSNTVVVMLHRYIALCLVSLCYSHTLPQCNTIHIGNSNTDKTWHQVQQASENKWILPFMVYLNGTENSPVRIHVRAAGENILVEIHAHKVVIKVCWSNSNEMTRIELRLGVMRLKSLDLFLTC